MVHDDLVSEHELKNIAAPYTGPLLPFVRALREFIIQHRDYIEANEEYQLQLVRFFGSIRLDPSRKRKRISKKSREQADIPDLAPESENTMVREPYSAAVMEFLRMKLTMKCYVRILLHIHDRIMPNLARPLLLADFLVSSFDRGGLVSILALNGLFTLVQEYHLDLPQFYQRLYELLTPQVLQAQYRARFFHLADKFMSSSHIPSYTVTAVAKRLSRLSLTAPADSLPLLLTFVMNLLIRHPDLAILIHRGEDEKEMDSDPYNHEELDMKKCGALNSSLWELLSLISHYNVPISKLASKLQHEQPEVEYDIRDHLETDIEEMLETALQTKASEEDQESRKPARRPELFAADSLWAVRK